MVRGFTCTVARKTSPALTTKVHGSLPRWGTSLGLAFFPELVHAELADNGAAAPSRFEAINRGWVSITRPWHLVSKNTGLGDPAAATADKGRLLMDVLVKRLGDFLVDLAKADVTENFPY